MSCEDWQKWLGHVQEMSSQMGDRTATQLDDAASQRWLATRSKPCPKCRSGHTHTHAHTRTHTHTHTHTHTSKHHAGAHMHPQAHTNTRVCVCLMLEPLLRRMMDVTTCAARRSVCWCCILCVRQLIHVYSRIYIQQPTLHGTFCLTCTRTNTRIHMHTPHIHAHPHSHYVHAQMPTV